MSIVHKNYIAPLQGGDEQFFDEEQHCFPINRPRDTQARAQAIRPKRPDRGDIIAPIPRDLIEDPLAGGRTAIPSGQSEIAAHFINKDVLLTIERAGKLPKLRASLFVALTRDETFFCAGGSGPVSPGRSWTG